MYRNLPFHVKNYFFVRVRICVLVVLRTACVFTFISFVSSFQFNTPNIALPQYITIHERKTVTSPLTQLIGENGNSNKIVNRVILFCSMIGLSVMMFLTFRSKNTQHLFGKYVRNILHKTKNENTRSLPEDLHEIETGKTPAKSLDAISTDTYTALLKKIEKFEKSEKFLRKDINLTWLSNHLNTNTKYLSEVIKTHKNTNFNGYINRLRIRYIITKLHGTPVYRGYKITYLAEECGYASSQVFAIAFKKETGATPSHFIEQLKNGTGEHDPTQFSA